MPMATRIPDLRSHLRTAWPLPAMVYATREYLERFLDAFDRTGYAPYRERFLRRNSERYLGLAPSDA
jgi:hypothetical protein